MIAPGDVAPPVGAAMGAALALIAIGAEIRLRRAELGRAAGAGAGLVVGLAAAALLAVTIGESDWASPVRIAGALVLGYVGLASGAHHARRLNPSALGMLSDEQQEAASNPRKILDTSVIIDGRIADIAEAGFIDGPLLIPQFVLWELQLVADSADGLKRNRGRRGLDILQRIQKLTSIDVRIVENDYPKLKEVDQKLIELAKELDAKIITNDFNLNKLSQLHGVDVLNINELANSLKAVVLPGETMNVFILKEGKEPNQGVAYLDDGTMVVVDNARRHISETIEIVVTSVLQTPAGKMIFGRYETAGQSSGQTPALDRKRSAPGKPVSKIEQAAGK